MQQYRSNSANTRRAIKRGEYTVIRHLCAYGAAYQYDLSLSLAFEFGEGIKKERAAEALPVGKKSSIPGYTQSKIGLVYAKSSVKVIHYGDVFSNYGTFGENCYKTIHKDRLYGSRKAYGSTRHTEAWIAIGEKPVAIYVSPGGVSKYDYAMIKRFAVAHGVPVVRTLEAKYE